MSDLEAPITEVTVYADRALVARKGTIHLDAGEHELRVNNLAQFQRDSLRVAGEGPQDTRILNVDITTAFHSRSTDSEILTLETELELLQQKRQLLQARQESLNDRRQWLRALGEQSHDFARGLAQGQMKPQDCADFFSFTAQQALKDAEAAQDLQLQQKQLMQDIEAKKRALAQKQTSLQPDRLAAIITVESPQAGDFTLELSYLVMNASWYPQYDARVQMNDEGEAGEVELTYVGMVQQATGEGWENITLSLSTAHPHLATTPPEIDPWYLRVYRPTPVVPRPMRTAAPALRNAPAAGVMSQAEPAMYAEVSPAPVATAPPPPAPAVIATTTDEHTGTSYVLRAGRSDDIPSDNSPHKTTIAYDHLPCEFDYVTAPALNDTVHLRATITNTTERVLLSGKASIFLGGEYVGTTEMKTTASNEQFKIFLGVDDSIKVKRALIERSVDKGMLLQSDLRRITYGYRSTVKNLHLRGAGRRPALESAW
jgi:uncharacterized protein (TIGR02231 family)